MLPDEDVVAFKLVLLIEPAIGIFFLFSLLPREVGDVFDIIHVDEPVSILIYDLVDSVKIFLRHSNADEFIESDEVLERETSRLGGVVLTEQLVKRIIVAVHHIIELHDPVNEQQSFEALFMFKLL